MIDFIHNTVLVPKILHYVGLYIYRYRCIRLLKKKLNYECLFLKNRDRKWFIGRLDYATFDIEDKDYEKTLNDATIAMNSFLQLLGGRVNVSGKIEWHKDFKNGYIWPKGKKYYKYQIIKSDVVGDVKTVWELSRCHHLLWFASAYQQTNEDKFVKRIIETIDDWIDDNPFERSINWVCPMEVAIRSVNWLFSLQMISTSNLLTKEFLRKVFISLYQHAYFIYNNLEQSYPFSENHYASDISGLLFLGYLFDDLKRGLIWRSFSIQAVFYEMRTQILPSGAHFERSISYHRLVTELFFYDYIIIKKNNSNLIAIDLKARLESMFDFINSYTKPNGFAPILADNDNGRFLPFVKRDYRDHRYLIDLALAYGIIQKPKVHSLFADAGFAFLHNDKYYLSFTNTGISRYNRPWKKGPIGTHTHLDALSFELSKGKNDFIIDSGSNVYTENKRSRDEFRSIMKHNTMVVDNENPYLLNDFFSIDTNGKYKYKEVESILLCNENETENLYSFFLWPNKDVCHHRNIIFDTQKIVIKDRISTKSYHDFIFNFHLAHDVEIASSSETSLLFKKGREELAMSIDSHVAFNFENMVDNVSPSYGVILKSTTIAVRISSNKDFEIMFSFQ